MTNVTAEKFQTLKSRRKMERWGTMLDIDAPDMETLGDSAIYDASLARNDGFVTPAITRARLAFEYRSVYRSCGSCK